MVIVIIVVVISIISVVMKKFYLFNVVLVFFNVNNLNIMYSIMFIILNVSYVLIKGYWDKIMYS